MKKEIIAQHMLSQFGLTGKEFENETPQERIVRRNKEYLAKDETERALMFGSVNASETYLIAYVTGMMHDVTELAYFAHRGKDFVDAHTRIIKKYFIQVFPDFDNGAAKSLGRHMKNVIKYIKKDSLEIRRMGASEHLFNALMKRLLRSTSPFFVKLKKNPKKMEVFKSVLRKYCEMVWLLEMQKEGTFSNNTLDLYREAESLSEKEKEPVTVS